MKYPLRGKKLITELSQRRLQLFAREQALKYYLANPNPSLSNKDFTEKDLEEVREQMEETAAAIRGVERWEKERKAAIKDQNTNNNENEAI